MQRVTATVTQNFLFGEILILENVVVDDEEITATIRPCRPGDNPTERLFSMRAFSKGEVIRYIVGQNNADVSNSLTP